MQLRNFHCLSASSPITTRSTSHKLCVKIAVSNAFRLLPRSPRVMSLLKVVQTLDRSPMPFGFFPDHHFVMTSYVTEVRAVSNAFRLLPRSPLEEQAKGLRQAAVSNAFRLLPRSPPRGVQVQRKGLHTVSIAFRLLPRSPRHHRRHERADGAVSIAFRLLPRSPLRPCPYNLAAAVPAVSIAFRLLPRSPPKRARAEAETAIGGLHCLSASSPITTRRTESTSHIRKIQSPLPFGFFPDHHIDIFMNSHNEALRCLHCLSASSPITTKTWNSN